MRGRVIGIGLASLLTVGALAFLQTQSQGRGASPQPTTVVPEEAKEVVALAIADFSAQLGVGEAEIRVVSVEAVDWPDTSLGYPQPGYAYAQVITPGFRIILAAQGQTYEYHTSYTNVVYIAE